MDLSRLCSPERNPTKNQISLHKKLMSTIVAILVREAKNPSHQNLRTTLFMPPPSST